MQHNPKLNPMLFSAPGNTFFSSQNQTVLLKVWNFLVEERSKKILKSSWFGGLALFLTGHKLLVLFRKFNIGHNLFVLFRKFTMTKL